MRKLSAALFDWDGTLVDSLEGIRIATNYALALLRDQGYEVEIGHTAAGYAQWTKEETQVRFSSTADAFFDNVFGRFGAEVAAAGLKAFRDKLMEVHLDNIEELAGARETLLMLYELGVPIAVVSNKDEDVLKAEVEYLFGPEIPGIVIKGADPSRRGKPYPDPLFEALCDLNASAGASVWMVGDSVSDIKAGFKAGAYPVLLTSVNYKTLLGLKFDPAQKSVLSGRHFGYADHHGKLQQKIQEAKVVPHQPYDPKNNPHTICKPQL